jgi:hypothetical protein
MNKKLIKDCRIPDVGGKRVLKESICSCLLMILTVSSMVIVPGKWGMAYANERLYSIHAGVSMNAENALKMAKELKRPGHSGFYRCEMIRDTEELRKAHIEDHESKGEAETEVSLLTHGDVISDYDITALHHKVEHNLKNESGKNHVPTGKSGITRGKDTAEILQPKQQQKETEAVIDRTKRPLMIKDITVKLEGGEKEIVAIYATRRFSPKVFALEGHSPRLVIDIKDINTFRRDRSRIPGIGEVIIQVRTHLHKDSKTLRVVLDLSPSHKHYEVSQIFYEADSVYAFEVVAKEEQIPKETKEGTEKGKVTE